MTMSSLLLRRRNPVFFLKKSNNDPIAFFFTLSLPCDVVVFVPFVLSTNMGLCVCPPCYQQLEFPFVSLTSFSGVELYKGKIRIKVGSAWRNSKPEESKADFYC